MRKSSMWGLNLPERSDPVDIAPIRENFEMVEQKVGSELMSASNEQQRLTVRALRHCVQLIDYLPPVTDGALALSACFGGGRFVQIGSGSLLWSDDGAAWHEGACAGNWTQISWTGKIVYGNGRFVAVPADQTRYCLTSEDGKDWQLITLPAIGCNGAMDLIAFGNGRFVIMGHSNSSGSPSYFGTSLVSTDGVNWTAQSVPGNVVWQGLAYGGGRFVAVGRGGSAYSLDGLAWYNGGDFYIGSGNYNYFRGITYGAGRFVALHNKHFQYSEDGGETWITDTDVYTALGSSTGLRYVSGHFFAWSTNANTSFLISEDGLNWRSAAAQSGKGHSDIAYGNDMYLAWTRNPPYIARSFDGEVWLNDSTGSLRLPDGTVITDAVKFLLESEDKDKTAADTDAMLIDHEFRLTLLELGVGEEE